MKFQWSLDVQLGERENQEDSSACRLGRKPGRAVFIVADGMGGHEAGEEASKAAVSAALAAVMAGRSVDRAMFDANAAVQAVSSYGWKSPGSTLDVLVIKDYIATIGHIGDSRVYIKRAVNGSIEQLTTDHNVPGCPNVLTRCLGNRTRENANEFDITKIDVCPGDRFLMCTDGLTDGLKEDVLSRVSKIFEMKISDGIDFDSLNYKPQDNCTTLLVAMVGSEE